MKRLAVRLAVTSLVAGVLPLTPMAVSPAHAAVADGVGYTLEGCRYDGVGDPYAGHPFTCPDSSYTTGNLGKGWAELDLVPHRITVTANTKGTVDLVVAGDALKDSSGNVIGWDYVSAPQLNTSLSAATGCAAPTYVAPYDPTAPAKKFGGADTSTYRAFTVDIETTSAKGCVYDYYQRLSVGSGGYPGSSLQSYVDGPSGQKRISIPVPVRKQVFTKDMTATRDANFDWSMTKSATGLTLGDTCGTATGSSGTATVTITWTKTAISGGNTLVTATFTATNPASRSIDVSVVDTTWEGTTAPGSVLVDTSPALTHTLGAGATLQWDYSFTTSSQAASFADQAVATYHDPIVGDTVGTRTATDSTGVATGATNDGTASIVDVESLNVSSGSGLQFSSTLPSGSFDAPYVAGTKTTGPITWRSGTLSSSGSAVFTKTVYADHGTSATASLDDTATLTKATSGATLVRSASIAIASSGTATLTLTKTAPNFYQGSDTSSFTIDLATGSTYADANKVGSHTFVFNASTPVVGGRATLSYTFTGLVAGGTYVLHEEPVTGWGPNSDIVVNLTGTSVCSSGAQFDNNPGPATAQARKVTVPAGSEAGWDLVLNGPGTAVGGEHVTTTGTGYVAFTTSLEEGSYTITENPTAAQAAGWDQTGASSECSFTVNYPADNDRTFSCTITNTQRGHIIVYKHTDPAGDPQGFTFTPSYNGGATFVLHDGESNDSGALVPGSYNVGETVPSGWTQLSTTTCSDGTSTFAPSAITLGAGKTVVCHFYNQKKGHVTLLKTENGGVPTHAYTFRLTGGPDSVSISLTTNSTNQGSLDFGLLRPGSYTICELAVPAGTHSTLQDQGGTLNATTGDICLAFTLSAGQTKAFVVDNSMPGGGQRTIGYWKNWNSCSGTGTNRVAMAAKTGNHLMDEFLPKLLGNYNVDTCAKGVAVLGAASGKYAENQLAAQLLAAKLNVAAGASSCATVTSAISHGDALLVQIGYTGPPSAKVGSTSSLRNDVLATASTLDRYNNGKIC